MQLLSFDSGNPSLRFCYYYDGSFQGGPLVVGESHIPALRREIRKNETIHRLLKRLV